MKAHDILIIGSSPLTQEIAGRLIQKGKDVAIVVLPGHPEILHAQEALAMRATNPIDLIGIQNLLANDFLSKTSPSIEYPGPGHFIDKNTFQTDNETLTAKKFIISTGCVSPNSALAQFAKIPCKSPLQILSESHRPNCLAVVGSGWRGIAMAQILAQKSQTHLMTRSLNLLRDEDDDVRQIFESILAKEGIHVWQNDRLPEDDLNAMIPAEEFIPNTQGFDFSKAGIYVCPSGQIVINEECRTSNPHAWALGPATNTQMDYAVEKQQAEIISANVLGQSLFKLKLDPDPTPWVAPTHPTYAKVGLTEKQALKQYPKDAKIFTFPFKKNMRSAIGLFEHGFIKIAARQRGAELLGVQILSPHAEEMVLYFDLIIRAGIPLSEFGDRSHFPAASFGEAIAQSIAAWLERFYS